MSALLASVLFLLNTVVASPKYSIAQECSAHQQERVWSSFSSVSCGLRPTTVELDTRNFTNVMQVIPSHVVVKRCGGACMSHSHSCHATAHRQVPVDVLVISATWGQGALLTLCSTLHVREDKDCSCACRVRPADCSVQQYYERNTCSCQCNNWSLRNACVSSGKTWDQTTCSCRCPSSTWRVCNTGYMFDGQNSCQCIPTVLLASTPIAVVAGISLISGLGVLALFLYTRRINQESLRRRESLAKVLEGDDPESDSK